METRVSDFTQFIEDAIALATQVEKDVTNGKQITSETVLALSRFVTTAEPVLTAMVAVNPDKKQLQ